MGESEKVRKRKDWRKHPSLKSFSNDQITFEIDMFERTFSQQTFLGSKVYGVARFYSNRGRWCYEQVRYTTRALQMLPVSESALGKFEDGNSISS